MKKPAPPTEHEEQVQLFAWAKLHELRHEPLQWMFAVRNEARTANVGVKSRFVLEGVKKGVPDIFLPVPRGKFHGFFIEMKRQGAPKSTIKPEQHAWAVYLRGQGYAHGFARGWRVAAMAIADYLGIERGEVGL